MMFGDMEARAKQKRYDPLPDFHLQNPLYRITNKLEKWERGVRLPVRLFKSLSTLKDQSAQIQEGSPLLLKICLEREMIKTSVHPPVSAFNDVKHRLKWDCRLANMIDMRVWDVAYDQSLTEFPSKSWDLMRQSQGILLALNALSSRRPMPNGWKEISSTLYSKSFGGLSIYVTPALIGLRIKRNGPMYVHDADWLRSVVDVFTERFLIRMAAGIGRRVNPMHYPELSLINEVISWGDGVLTKHGNRGFKLLKAFEALCLGVLQEMSQSTFLDNSRFLNNTLSDLSAEDIDFGKDASSLVEILRKMESPHHLTQIYGLHRIWGHPLVDPEEGMLKMLKIGQKDIIESGRLPRILGSQFKKMFARSFRDKNGVYPNFQPDRSTLYSLLQNNEDWSIVSRLEYEEEWEMIHFSKMFDIPESFNLSMIVADKSVSPTLSELKTNILTRGTVMNAELRRGVLRWINHDSIDPREFLKEVADGKFPHDHKIIGLRSKERELNPTPRMFALMSHLMRVYVVITESMLSEHILPHFPQITMTDDLLSLTKKTYSTVRNQSKNKGQMKHKASKTICMSLDFEKWNGHMRQEGTLDVFKELGNLFGLTDLYHVTYDIFKESFFYLADGSYVPEVEDNGNFKPSPPRSFTGHKGGQEGLRQKGWTIFTVVGLDWVCSRHNVTYKIMGMGDNQVLQLTFHTNKVDAKGAARPEGIRDMKRTLNNVFTDLLETFNSLGLPLKPLETWMSEDLFVYGKYPIWQGVPLSMDLKKLMRIFPFSNQEMMTTENILNTIAGNAQAATQASPHLGLSYVIGLFMLSVSVDDLLDYHPLLGCGLINRPSKDRDSWRITIGKRKPIVVPCGNTTYSRTTLRRLIMIIPRILGGYVSFNIFGLLMRGFPDPLSLALSQLYAYGILKDETQSLNVAIKNWLTPVYMPDRSYQLLTEDVSSVNLLAPVTPIAGLRREVENYLSSGRTIRNPEFQELMRCRDADCEAILSEAMCEGDTLHIRLIHDILESTIFGYVKSIVSKVTKSSTILSLAIDKSTRDPLSAVIENEFNYFKFFLWRSSIREDVELPLCPTTLAKKMRYEGWGKQLVGVTVAFPFSYLERTDCHHHDRGCDCKDGFISLFLGDSSVDYQTWNTTIGKNPPYLGSMTKEKLIITSGARVYSSEPLVRRPINLMRVIGWFVPEDSNTASIIKSCVSAVSDVDPNSFKGVTEGTSGSEIHRYKDSSLKHGALCSSNYLYSTRYHLSTDSFIRYAKGSQNYDMMFQANLCAIVESTHLEIVRCNQRGDPLPKFYHFKQTCYDCINPLDESFHDIPSTTIPQLLPTRKSNRYLYVPEDKISLTMYIKPFPSWISFSITSEEFDRMGDRDKMAWLGESLVDNIISDILSPSEELTYVSSSLLDIKEHNRLFYLAVNPKDIFLDLCSRLLIIGEWRCLCVQDWKIPTPEAVLRSAVALLVDSPLDKLAGMAGFFTWPEVMRRYYFSPEIVEPDTIPVTVESACKAIKISLINLLHSNLKLYKLRSTHMFLEENKTSKLVLKMMVYDHVKRVTNEWCCLRSIANLSPSSLSKTTPELIVCSQSHVLFPKGATGLIADSKVSMDALKKSINTKYVDPDVNMERKPLPPLDHSSCHIIYSSNRMRARMVANLENCPSFDESVDVQPLSCMDLYKLFSLPTNASYKYYEIISFLIKDLGLMRHCFLTGNGLGGSSNVLLSLWGRQVTISTMMDPEACIPQAYPNADKAFKFSMDTRVNSSTMINAVNDISHPRWLKDWQDRLPGDADWFLSDIEINKENDTGARHMIMEKLSCLKKWKMGILKDYIYSKREFIDRMSLANRYYNKVQLLTCCTRQRVMPEVWWVLYKRREDPLMTGVYYSRTETDWLWEEFKDQINHCDPLSSAIISEINLRLASKETLEVMLGRVRMWATIPIVGSMLPHKKTYTRALGYLQRGKRPIDIKPETDGKGRKLYVSDYMRVREVLFGMAVAMVGNIKEREKLLDDSRFWILDWHTDIGGLWIPFLKRVNEGKDPIHIYDYVPMLSVLMKRENLLFERVDYVILFKHNRKRDVLCFPITKAAMIKYTGLKMPIDMAENDNVRI